MDYKRIYKDFVLSRRNLEKELVLSGKYYESHHILPRSMGGSDDPENVIKLLAEDHLFCHLLLTKIYGGKMWLAVKSMLDFEPNIKKPRRITSKRLRKEFSFVRKQAAKYFSDNFSGQDSPSADQEEYTIVHLDGQSITGHRTHIIENTNLGREKLSAILVGTRPTANGWYFPKYNPTGRHGTLSGNDSPSADKNIYNFYHISGEKFTGTQTDFKKYAGRSGNELVRGYNKCTQDGWALNPDDCALWTEGAQDRAQNAADARGDISGIANPRADHTIYTFVNTESGDIKKCTRVEMRDFIDVTSARIQGVLDGSYKSNNWTLEQYISKQKTSTWANRGKNITIKKGGETFTGTRKECANYIGVSQSTACAFAAGRYKTCKGWVLLEK